MSSIISTYESGARRPALPVLTSLRFFAALLVVVLHCDLAIHPSIVDGLLRSGYRAVSFFFVLSGFILTYVYTDRLVTAPGFWAMRAARILPLYYLGLLLAAPQFLYPALILHTTPLRQLLGETALTLVLMQSWVPSATHWNLPAWSLSVEAFFYALFPFQLWLMSRHSIKEELIIACVAVIAASLVWLYIVPAPPYFPVLHWPSFTLGMALGRAFVGSRFKITSLMFYAVCLLVIAILSVTDDSSFARTNLVLIPLFGLLIFFGAHEASVPKWLGSPTLVLLGDASYALYILHLPLMFWWHVARFPVLSNLPWALGFITIAVLISVLVHLYLERPAKRWLLGQSFTSRAAVENNPGPA